MNLRISWLGLLYTLALLVACSPSSSPEESSSDAPQGKPSLSVQMVEAQIRTWPVALTVNGSVAPWQEAVIGSQLSGIPIAQLLAQTGDAVKKGQLLAQFDQAPVLADLAQAKGAVAEAQAVHEQARFNAELIRGLENTGAVSAQERNQILAAEKSALARLQSAKAAQTQQEIRLTNTRVVALDDGVISARNATLGAVPNPGEPLFRLVRQQRLEWRAEVTAEELVQLRVGMPVRIQHGEGTVQGKVRALGPAVDAQSRIGLVYVDLPGAYGQGLRPGMFVRGQFVLAEQEALLVPQSAVVERDGFTYVFVLQAGSNQVQRIKVKVDRSTGEWVRVLEGLQAGQAVVKTGVAFLADGDLVKVVQ
ncbi:MAG TPA: efflux RND transporter periplasmic adaptor subunit [Limnobacter sp.]|nr:efflux RND transporter periplasmic adaptor subunit [Limnobacter sp.]